MFWVYIHNMARPKRKRRVQFMPEVTLFKPSGVPAEWLKQIDLSVDELEAIRLVDFKNLDQHQAAEQMKVSQSTLQRILSSAREKVAKALVLGRAISVKGGEVDMVNRGRGQGPRGGQGRGRRGGPFKGGPGGMCVCTNPDCDHEEKHIPGEPCYQQKCSECGSPMIRRRSK